MATLTTAQSSQATASIHSKRRKVVTRVFTQETLAVQDFHSGFIFKCDTTSTGVNVTIPTAAASNKGNYYHFIIENGPGTGTLTFTFSGGNGQFQGYYHNLDQWLDTEDDTGKVDSSSTDTLTFTGATKGTHLIWISDGGAWNLSGFAAMPRPRPNYTAVTVGDTNTLEDSDHRGISLIYDIQASTSQVRMNLVTAPGFKHYVYMMSNTTTNFYAYQLATLKAGSYFVHNNETFSAGVSFVSSVATDTPVGPDFWELTSGGTGNLDYFTGFGGSVAASMSVTP